VQLILDEATRRWPRRSTASDGAVGDAAHRARVSDHNPDSRGIVHAADLTHDPAHGVDCNVLAELLRARKDGRIRYVIWQRRIYLGPWDDEVMAGRGSMWAWQPYDGENPHTKHMHVSVGHHPAPENDVRPWYEPKGELSMADVQKILDELQVIKDALAVTGSTGPDQSQQLLFDRVTRILNALAIEGTTGPEDSIEKLYARAKGADLKADQALARLDQQAANLTEIRGLVEQILLQVGGSEPPA
jgi:hypothetical protein